MSINSVRHPRLSAATPYPHLSLCLIPFLIRGNMWFPSKCSILLEWFLIVDSQKIRQRMTWRVKAHRTQHVQADVHFHTSWTCERSPVCLKIHHRTAEGCAPLSNPLLYGMQLFKVRWQSSAQWDGLILFVHLLFATIISLMPPVFFLLFFIYLWLMLISSKVQNTEKEWLLLLLFILLLFLLMLLCLGYCLSIYLKFRFKLLLKATSVQIIGNNILQLLLCRNQSTS